MFFTKPDYASAVFRNLFGLADAVTGPALAESQQLSAASNKRATIRAAQWFSTSPFRPSSSGARRLLCSAPFFLLKNSTKTPPHAVQLLRDLQMFDRLEQMEQRYD